MMTRRTALAALGATLLHRRRARAAEAPAEADRPAVVASSNGFAFDLYGRLRGGDRNACCSPSSVSSGLAMTLAGARGTTASEMATVLHVSLPPRRFRRAQDLRRRERARDRGGRATAVVARPTSMPRPFHVVHPFFFLIRDNRTGTILFMGRLVNPLAT